MAAAAAAAPTATTEGSAHTGTKGLPAAPAGLVDDGQARLRYRQRAIDFGRNTLGYDNYLKAVPRHKRGRSDPRTPDPLDPCSKKAWDGKARVWRRALHRYDPDAGGEELTQDMADLADEAYVGVPGPRVRACMDGQPGTHYWPRGACRQGCRHAHGRAAGPERARAWRGCGRGCAVR